LVGHTVKDISSIDVYKLNLWFYVID